MRKKRKHKFWRNEIEVTYYDKNKKAKWTKVIRNALADEGEQHNLKVYLQGLACAGFYLGLCNSTPEETTALATLVGEPSGNGYERQAIERSDVGWPTIELHGGDYRGISKLVWLEADGGAIGPFTTMFLCDVLSGDEGAFIAWASLGGSFTIEDQESMGFKLKVKQK